MFGKYPVYFLQTQEWADYWQKVNLSGHEYFYFKVEKELEIENHDYFLKLQSFAYLYPWQLKQRFLYVPRFPSLEIVDSNGQKKDDYKFFEYLEVRQKLKKYCRQMVVDLLSQIRSTAVEVDCSFIKLDFDDYIADLFDIHNKSELKNYLENLSLGFKTVESSKIVQYLSCMTLLIPDSLSKLQADKDMSMSSLSGFYSQTRDFWLTTSENVRRYTKKSLDKGWLISTEKSEENFEAFWQVYTHTTETREFATHPKKHFREMLDRDFCRLITIRNALGEPHSVWMGMITNQTLTYLYGGNTPTSLKNHGQYLMHLAALKLMVSEGLIYYSLGGYDSTKGFGKFKDNYHGLIRSFLGPVDLVIKPLRYKLTNLLIKTVKLVKNS